MDTTSSSGSSSQTIIVIILIIIGIILFIFLIIESIFIPAVQITPFADGSKIKIKSLGNGRYIRPISCSDLANLDSNCPPIPSQFGNAPTCGSVGDTFQPIIADGLSNDRGVIWTVCQYKGKLGTASQEIEAPYLVMNTSNLTGNLMTVFPGDFPPVSQSTFLFTETGQQICPAITGTPIDATCESADLNRYFNFVLEDKVNPSDASSSNQTGTYMIHTLDPRDLGLDCSNTSNVSYIYCNGQLSGNCSIPFVNIYNQSGGGVPDRNSSDEILNYSFLIEVQPS